MLTEAELRELLGRRLAPRDDTTRAPLMGAGSDDLESGRRHLAALADTGLAVPRWPAAFGGRGCDASDAALVARVLGEFAAPDLYPYTVGLRMVGPTLLEHGTDAQRTRWLRAIADGSEIWCQLFSEPEAGSDLANLATSARRDGAQWVLDGQKVWTSRGSYARWGLCLARTDPSVPKHAGLTMFAVDMRAEGVDVRPLEQMNGDRHFSETFLTGVAVHDDDRIGAVGDGWRVALTVLAHERAGADRSAPSVGPRRLPAWLVDLADSGALADPVRRDRAMALFAYDQAIRLTQERAAASARTAGRPGPEGSGFKLHGAASFKRRADLTAEAGGAHAMLTDWTGHLDLLTAPSMSIRGGTDEIQRNIVAERVLGLPSEPRVDRDVPWSTSRRGGHP